MSAEKSYMKNHKSGEFSEAKCGSKNVFEKVYDSVKNAYKNMKDDKGYLCYSMANDNIMRPAAASAFAVAGFGVGGVPGAVVATGLVIAHDAGNYIKRELSGEAKADRKARKAEQAEINALFGASRSR